MTTILKTAVLVLTLFLFSCSATEDKIELECDKCTPTELEYNDEVFNLINNYRSVQGFKMLKKDSLCAKDLAKDHSRYMDSLNILSHDGFGDRSNVLISRGASNTGEIGGRQFKYPIDLVYAFTQSERHNEVMIRDFEYIGIGKYNEFVTILFYK